MHKKEMTAFYTDQFVVFQQAALFCRSQLSSVRDPVIESHCRQLHLAW